MRRAGIWPTTRRSTSATGTPSRSAVAWLSSTTRSVFMNPDRIGFTVTPSAVASFASVRAKPITAERIELESISPSIACLAAIEFPWITRPHLRSRMPGNRRG